MKHSFHISFKTISRNNVEVIHLPSRESIISLLKTGTLFCPFLVFKLFYYPPWILKFILKWILKTLREQFGNLLPKLPHYFGANSILIREPRAGTAPSLILSFLLDENDDRKGKIRTLSPLFYSRQSLFTTSNRQKKFTPQRTHQRCSHFNPWLGRILFVTY